MQEMNPPQPSETMIGKLLVASTSVQDPVLSRSVSLVVHQDSDNVFAVLLNRPMTPPPGLMQLLGSVSGETSQAGGGPSNRLVGKGGAGSSLSGASLTGAGSFPTNLPGAETAPSAMEDAADKLQSAGNKHALAAQAAAEASKSLGMIHFGGPLSGPVVAVHNSSEHAEAQAGKGIYVAAQRDMLETLVRQKPGPFRLIVGHLGWSIDQLRAEREAGFWHVIDATDEDVFAGDHELWPMVIRRATTRSVADWLGIKDTPFAAEVN
ncbi:transcriptional regulator [Rhodopirellula sp. SM50]|nr:transcriptional regulator [Rhodopirellula sp. SM50]